MERGTVAGLHFAELGGATLSILADSIQYPDAKIASHFINMNNRFFFALVLTAIVIVVTPLLFPTSTQRTTTLVATDSTVRGIPRDTSSDRLVAAAILSPNDPASVRANSTATPLNTPRTTSETTTVRTLLSTYKFSARGAVPVSVVLDSYPSTRKDIAAQSVQLNGAQHALISYQLVLGRDTIVLDTASLRVSQVSSPEQSLTYTGEIAGRVLRLMYMFPSDTADSYLIRVNASVANPLPGATLLIGLPRTLHPNEADTLDDLNHLAVSYRSLRGEVNSIAFSKLDSSNVHVEQGPLTWVATRNKYFLIAYRADKTPFASLRLQGLPRKEKVAGEMQGHIALPIGVDGSAAFEIYAGPQSFQRLQHLGGDLDQVNPYAGILHGVVQPFTTIVMKALLWMKRTTQLNYGWVLVLFGVIVRLILWPLNQGAMRTSMKMQRLQPELQALQKKYSDDPKKQQEAIMKVYKEHGMSPLSPLMGCLPMLLPMPVLFALYQVFQNTIEFRGVPFFWLADISLRDPYYITPLLMGVSMFVMSWIGMRNLPPNPQAKMMSYMMPVMLTVLFLNFASGLNLYYAVQNIAAIPQQWLLARERAKQPQIVSVSLDKRRTQPQ